MADDRAALLGAAIRAACLAKAPRRTIQAVASAVAGVLIRPCTASTPTRVRTAPSDTQCATTEVAGDSPEVLLEALRASRRAQRLRKKQRRKAAKQVARNAESRRRDAVVPDVAECAVLAMPVETTEATPNVAVKREAGHSSDAPPHKRGGGDEDARAHSSDRIPSVQGCPQYPRPCPSAQVSDYEEKRIRRCRHVCRGLSLTEISRIENEERLAVPAKCKKTPFWARG